MNDTEIFGSDGVHDWCTKSMCRHMLYEGCDLWGLLRVTGSTYRACLEKRKYKNFKDETFRNHAIQIMSEFYDYMSADIDIWPMFGTLLGMVRDDDLIEHDDDIDFGYLKRDEHMLVKKLDSLHNTNGYQIIRNEFSNLYSLVKQDVLIDLYEYEELKESNFLQQGHRTFYNIKNEEMFPMGTIEFRGKTFKCINNPVKFLERYYGKDWKQPK